MTRTPRRLLSVFVLSCALVFALGATSAFAVTLTPTNAPLPGSNFQGGDGNQDNPNADVGGGPLPMGTPDGVTDVDWQSIPNASGAADATQPLGDQAFAGGDKESEPGAWGFQFEGAGVNPSKDNLLAAWSASSAGVSGTPSTFLNLAFTREAQTGNTFITFEVNQLTKTWNNGTTDIPCRTTGDLLISYNVASGGTPPNVDVVVYQWTTDTFQDVGGDHCAKTGHFTQLDPQPFAEAAMNKDTITNYLTAGGLGNTFAPGTWGETSLNLTGILNGINENICTDFGQVGMHTRSSTSIDSQLQDYITPVPIITRSCKLKLDKQVSVNDPAGPYSDGPVDAQVGDTLYYKIAVSNTGSQPLDVTTNDTKCGDTLYATPDGTTPLTMPQTLQPGETGTYYCRHTVAEGDGPNYVNKACTSGVTSDDTAATGDPDASALCDTVTVHVPGHPQISTTASGTTELGQPIHDTAHLSGGSSPTGSVSFTVYGPNDTNCTGEGVDVGSGQIDENGDAVSPDYTPTAAGTYRFVAHYAGDDNNVGADGACNDANESVDVLQPKIAIDKTGPAHAYDGDVIKFDITVTNPGTAPVHDVTLGDQINGTTHGCDSISGPTGDTNNDGLLDPSETWKYVCTYTVQHADEDSTHHVVNTATVSGKNSAGDTVGPVSDDAPVLITHPAIAIDKSGPANATQGDKVSYQLTVTNPGDTPLLDPTVKVSDEQCNGDPVTLQSKGGDASPDTLDPGDTWTYTCSVQTAVGQTSIHNVASVTGCDQFGKCVNASDDANTVLDAQVLLPERITPGAARLLGPTGCVSRAFNARVRGTKMATVTFVLDGKVVKKVTNTSNAKLIQARIDPKQLRLGVHRLVVNVTFQSGSGTKPKSMRLSFQRCGKKLVAPRFTG